jgi:uncharacterized membrane protein
MGVAVIAGAVALLIGWHFSQAHMAHRAIPGRRSQLGPLRRDRTRHLIRVVGTIVVIALVFIAIIR